MLKHIVLWRFKDQAEGKTKEENMAKVKAALSALLGVVPELKQIEFGTDELHSDMSFDMCVTCVFEDLNAMNAYKIHPEHKKVSQFVSKVRTDRAVIDYYF